LKVTFLVLGLHACDGLIVDSCACSMPATGTFIRGTVLDAAGAPLPHIPVEVRVAETDCSTPRSLESRADADASGMYTAFVASLNSYRQLCVDLVALDFRKVPTDSAWVRDLLVTVIPDSILTVERDIRF